MRKLLSADFSRLYKSRVFYMAVIFMVLLAVFRFYSATGEIPPARIDDGFFVYAVFIGIVMGAFVSLFVGTEHSSHTIRNKLIVGHTRANVYLSNFIVCTVAGWIFCSCYLVFEMVLGISFEGGFVAKTADVVATIVCIYALTAVYGGIFVFITMIFTNRAATAVVCILSALALIVFGVIIIQQLEEPEKVEIMEYAVNEPVINEEDIKMTLEDNPRYISDKNTRKAYEILSDAFPGGQSIRLSGMIDDIKMPSAMLFLYDALIIFITNGLGIMIFKKKDLK